MYITAEMYNVMFSLCIAFWMTSLPTCYEMQTVNFAFSRLY